MITWLKKQALVLYDWVDYRTGIQGLMKDQLTEYRVPPKLNKWYSLGGLALFVLIMQLVTGVLLLVYYVPSTEEGFASVQRIMLEIPYGWLIRVTHAVGSHAMVFVLILHMVSVVCMGSYKKPREVTWLTGCALLFLSLGICFTGYLLTRPRYLYQI
jgi:quinol-cytochrome oxidoreductase complex cytochrome b subunit